MTATELPIDIRWRIGAFDWTEEEAANLLLWASNSGCIVHADPQCRHLSYFKAGKQSPLQKRLTREVLDRMWGRL